MNPKRLTDTFLKMRTSLKSAALRITGNEPDSEDAIQEAFIRLWTRHENLDDNMKLEGYINRSVRNSSVDIIRRRTDFDNVDDCPNLPEENLPDLFQPDRYSQVKEIIELHLPALQRQIITLRDIEMLEFNEIAIKTGIPETTVRVYLSRARAKIREIYNSRYE